MADTIQLEATVEEVGTRGDGTPYITIATRGMLSDRRGGPQRSLLHCTLEETRAAAALLFRPVVLTISAAPAPIARVVGGGA